MKNTFFYILFLMSSAFAHAQVHIEVVPDVRDLREDQQLKLTVILEIIGEGFNGDSKVLLPDTSKFTVIGSASKRNTAINPDSQKGIYQLVYQIVLQPKQTGAIKIGSAIVIVNNRTYKTEPFDVFVTKGEAKTIARSSLEDEMYLNLEIKKKDFYKNEPTLAILRIFSRNFDNFRKISHIKTPQNNKINFRQVDAKRSDIEQDNSKMSSQIIAVFVISSKESGTVEIPSVSAVIKNSNSVFTLKSNKVRLNVKNLPANSPESYKNAVGKFDIKMTSDSLENYEIGKPINVKIRISGEGNFRTMILPKLSASSNYSFFAPKINYNIKNTPDGFKGNVDLNYVVIPKKSGKITLESEPFSYFDQDTKTYSDLKSDTLSFAAMSTDEINNSKSTLDKVNDYTINVLQTVNTPKIIANHLLNPKKNTVNYKTIFLNLVLLTGFIFLVFMFRKKKKKKKTERLSVAKPTSKIENVSEAEARLLSEEEIDINVELAHLERLKNSKTYPAFFQNFETLLADLEIFSEKKFGKNFKNYILQQKGAREAENFSEIKQVLAIEKFAPFPSEENIEIVFEKFSKIVYGIQD